MTATSERVCPACSSQATSLLDRCHLCEAPFCFETDPGRRPRVARSPGRAGSGLTGPVAGPNLGSLAASCEAPWGRHEVNLCGDIMPLL